MEVTVKGKRAFLSGGSNTFLPENPEQKRLVQKTL